MSPKPTLTMIFHFHTCSSGRRNALPVNMGSAGSASLVGDALSAVVVTSCVVPLATDVETETLYIESELDDADAVVATTVVDFPFLAVDSTGTRYVAFSLGLGYPLAVPWMSEM
jgi:hypothetical protein